MDVKKLNDDMFAAYSADDGDGIICCMFGTGVEPVGILKDCVEAGNERGLSDDGNHETSTTYLIAKDCPKVKFISYNIFPKGTFSKTVLIAAMQDMLDRMKRDRAHRYVGNMSFGGGGYIGESTIDKINELGKAIIAAGGSITCSAGNDDKELKDNRFPACFEWPFTCTALEEDGSRADFSCWLDEADFAELGRRVHCMTKDGMFSDRSGTSFSSPLMNAKTVKILSRHKRTTGKWLTDAELYEKAKSMAQDLGAGGLDPYFGWGFLDLLKEETKPSMKVYLSASTQEGNPVYPLDGIKCKTEEDHCNAVMDAVAVRLMQHKFTIQRNEPSMNYETSYKAGNAFGADMYLCFHTNGSNDKTKRGAYWAYITQGGKNSKLAELLATYTSMDGVTVKSVNKTGADGFGELDLCTAKHAAYAELGYHSSKEDHAWLHRNMTAIVEGIVKAVCEYTGVVYLPVGTEPEPKPEPTLPALFEYSGASFVNLRDKPSTSGTDIGDVKAGDKVIVLSIENGWADVVKHNESPMQRGYCTAAYLRRV